MLSAQVTSVGIIGTGSPIGDWDTDVDMVQDEVDTSMWTLDVTLNAGVLKFRANDSWDVNWGATDFPNGIGEQGGPDIPVYPGDYTISFNHVTGEYSFNYDSDIGIIGPATPIGDWDTDVNMFRDTADVNKFWLPVNLNMGDCKFRKDDAWDRDWGNDAGDFPSGVATVGGGNIPVASSGFYVVTLDTLTGEYSFGEQIDYEGIGLIGTATSIGDWDTDVDLVKDANNPSLWTGSFTLNDGEAKFRANDSWDINWGGPDFPTGVGIQGSADNIPVVAGDYFVSFNTETLEYSFSEIVEYESMGIIGDATEFGEWETEVPMEKDANDPHMWFVQTILNDGEAKFRANNNWDNSWGGPEFPIGVGELNGTTNIPVTGAEYRVSFNSITGEYVFEEVIEYETVGIVGLSGENMDWDTDLAMDVDADDPHLWTIASTTVSDTDPDVGDQGVKFRAEADWTVNWGSDTWPDGVGVQDGSNIPTVAGTYGVVFNSLTGEYAFGDPISSTQDVVNPSAVSLFPNPAQDVISVNLESVGMQGVVNVKVFEASGRNVRRIQMNYNELMTISIADLVDGNYYLQIANDQYLVAKQFVVSR